MREYKYVTYKHLKPGQKIEGHKTSGSNSSYSAYVKSINSAYVTVEMWKIGGVEQRIDSDAMFALEMSKKEIEEKYKDKAKEVLINIQNKLHADEIGYHEMWNAWLYGTPYEMASYCIKENIEIKGYCSDITPKTAMFSGDKLDIGVCAEYEDGERFWCHYRYADIETMLERNKDILES